MWKKRRSNKRVARHIKRNRAGKQKETKPDNKSKAKAREPSKIIITIMLGKVIKAAFLSIRGIAKTGSRR